MEFLDQIAQIVDDAVTSNGARVRRRWDDMNATANNVASALEG
jgi:hypothetical protein